MGESSIREGIQIERVAEVEIMLDQPYSVRSVQSADTATLRIIGFGSVDTLDGVEIVGVTPTPPEGTIIDTGDFSVFIIYGMAGVAAIAGIIFFFISNRSLKNEKVGQQGIDPTRLVGYETSDSSGGYKTNRGEAQLRDDSDYQQTRSYYDNTSQPQSPPPQASSPAAQEPACGCAASADMGSECDCVMQGACLCDGTCQCGDDICKEHTGSMR